MTDYISIWIEYTRHHAATLVKEWGTTPRPTTLDEVCRFAGLDPLDHRHKEGLRDGANELRKRYGRTYIPLGEALSGGRKPTSNVTWYRAIRTQLIRDLGVAYWVGSNDGVWTVPFHVDLSDSVDERLKQKNKALNTVIKQAEESKVTTLSSMSKTVREIEETASRARKQFLQGAEDPPRLGDGNGLGAPDSFVCAVCGRTFESAASRGSHMASRHSFGADPRIRPLLEEGAFTVRELVTRLGLPVTPENLNAARGAVRKLGARRVGNKIRKGAAGQAEIIWTLRPEGAAGPPVADPSPKPTKFKWWTALLGGPK